MRNLAVALPAQWPMWLFCGLLVWVALRWVKLRVEWWLLGLVWRWAGWVLLAAAAAVAAWWLTAR